METEILCNAEILAQTTGKNEKNVGLEVWRKACKWACVIAYVKAKLKWTKHSSCNKNGSAAQNVTCLTFCFRYVLMAFLVEMEYRRVGCHELT